MTISVPVKLSLAATAAIATSLFSTPLSAQAPPNLEDPVTRRLYEACQSEIDRKFRGTVDILEKTLRQFSVSKDATRFRGRAKLTEGRKSRRIEFDCILNDNTEQVSSLTYKFVATTNQPIDPTRAIVTTSTRPLNIRSGPGLNYPVVGSVANGSSVQLTGRVSGDWAELASDRWVNRTFLRYSP
jgi:uncharacterized protein YgiM (DUF1202 family)